MFKFNYDDGATTFSVWAVWFLVMAALFILNEFSRRWRFAGFLCFFILPTVLTVVWFTVLRDVTYTDWFHLAKVYSATAGCIGFWFIRYLKKTNSETGEVTWRLVNQKWALYFPPLILAINIIEACMRDFQVGSQYYGGGLMEDSLRDVFLLGGPWNFMNGIAGIINIITITGWIGIGLRKKTLFDSGRDMIWPDMLWFWIIAYDIWNFAYTYNCLPHHSWYCGFALLLAPTLCAFTLGRGAWLQHRAHTLALWCMFAQTFPAFQDLGRYAVDSSYNPTIYMTVGVISLAANIAVFIYMIYKIRQTGKNPYASELYTDLYAYKKNRRLMG